MTNKNVQPPHQSSTAGQPRRGWPKPSSALLLALAAVSAAGCFRATGIQRSAMVAEVIPETGGDRIPGLKSKGGSGDFYLGNDFVQIVVDGYVPGGAFPAPLAGAPSGGGIIDAGYLELDSSFSRVSVPGNAMHRITPVVNQDPDMQVIWDTITPSDDGGTAYLTMTGRLLDPNNSLGTGASPVAGVTVSQSISVTQLERFFLVTTTVTNQSGAALGIRNIGDCLRQQGGGYHFNVPANFDHQGNALATPWGVQIPGTDFSQPLANSVQASMVGLMDTEPGAATVDSHASLGLLPVDADNLLVASDPQDLVTVSSHLRPTFPARLVAGSLPAAGALANGASLTYRRRLYIVGGQSVAATMPNQATGLFNAMEIGRHVGDNLEVALRPHDTGTLSFTLSGTSVRQGPRPTQVRIERNVAATTSSSSAGAVWRVERVEWLTPNENISSRTTLAPSTLSVLLPTGNYRMVLTNQNATQTRTSFENTNASSTDGNGNTWQDVSGPIWIQRNQTYIVSTQDILCPDVADGNQVGSVTSNPWSVHTFTTRERNGVAGNLQPLRITFAGTGTSPDPSVPRQRTLGTCFDAEGKAYAVAAGAIPGQCQYRAGNEMFGTAFANYLPAQYAWLPNGGTFTAYGQRGPLSQLLSLDLVTYEGQTDTSHEFIVTPMGLPPNWTSFDLPGPSQATTGGYLPGEKLASALANGVQVVGDTEMDLAVDATQLYNSFMAEFNNTNMVASTQRPASLGAINRPASIPFGVDPFVVGARTSNLGTYGTATALFTPAASAARMGGAQDSTGWILADFLSQAQGGYNVLNRPRGPQGLFTQLGAPAGASWWNGSGPVSYQKVNGDFDAIELLRGEGLDSADPTAWFAEFQLVRADWFALLNTQTPAAFTKALGLSSANTSYDTPVGLARTYLKASPITQNDLGGVLTALKSGAAVASTGPFLEVNVGAAGPGGMVAGPVQAVNLVINLWKTDWMPVDEVRVIVNGNLALTVDPASLVQSGSDARMYSGMVSVPMPSDGKDAWIVVEAGVPLATTGAYRTGTPWNKIMRGIYPIAVTNPIFVNVTGTLPYTSPS
jgi:hypothetical protein